MKSKHDLTATPVNCLWKYHLNGLRKYKITILFLIDQVERATAGSEQHLSFLLKNLPQDRFRVLLAVLRTGANWDKAEFPIDPICLGLSSFYHFNTLIRAAGNLTRHIHEEQIDILHTFFPDSELLGVIVKALKKSLCLVSARRNMGYWHTPSSFFRARVVSRFVPHFIANCHAVKQRVSRIENVSPDKIHVIYNPVNRARIRDGLQENISRSDLEIKNGVPVIGMVANFRPVKDYECFLRACRIIADEEPNAKFLVVGSGPRKDKQRLHNRIYELGLRNSVMDLGERSNPIPLVRLFDVGVLTSRSEGLSNALIEYGALGVPSVASAVGGNAEIVIDGVTGFLVPPALPEAFAKRVLDLVRKKELRKSYGMEAKRYVFRKFDETAIISAYGNYYGETLNQLSGKEAVRNRL